MNQLDDSALHSKQFIALVVKMQHGVLCDLGNSWITQVTHAGTPVQVFFQFRALPVIFNLQQMFPLTTRDSGMESARRKVKNKPGKS